MILSIMGLVVFAILFYLGRLLGSAPLIGLLASLPFGATAFMKLPALGGSSPLIYALFACVTILFVIMRRSFLKDFGTIFLRHKISWVVLLLVIYAIVSAIVFPRFFQGKTTAFAVVGGVSTELPLHPVSGNITQTAYFTLGVLTFYALLILLQKAGNLAHVYRGYFVFVTINMLLGLVDLGGKLAAGIDVLEPIRTANFAFLTNVVEVGFVRIAGGFSEASGFALICLTGLAFGYTNWRLTESRLSLALTVTLLLLTLLSTSSTAYAGLAILSMVPFFTIVRAIFSGRLHKQDFIIMLMGALLVFIITALYMLEPSAFRPALELFDRMVVNKASSSSGQERFYWNWQNLMTVFDTYGVGIGMGSSRSSSWIISLLAQLGLFGTLLGLICVGVIIRGMRGLKASVETSSIFVNAASIRAATLAYLIAICISGAGADPGIFFFISLATITASRHAIIQRQYSRL